MKNILYTSILIFVGLISTACASKTTETPSFRDDLPYIPQAGDSEMQRDEISIESSMVASTRSLPPQIMVRFTYFPPTACHQLRVEVSVPDAENKIYVSAYAVVEKDSACNLMALVTPLDESLGLVSYPAGHYNLILNDTSIGEFDT